MSTRGKVLVTGAAGFIGFHVAKRLLADGHEVVGIDNLNPYYDVKLKEDRVKVLNESARASGGKFTFKKVELADQGAVKEVFKTGKFARVVHLAAQAGVRYSLENPHVYVDSNVTGHLNILEGCRHHPVEHLVYASSSSVYGNHTKLPWSEHDPVDHPISLYAATKKANELMSHSYSHLFKIPTTGLRFFTVYGPWGRPDMALFLFTKAILAGKEIEIFNNGKMRRDFTFVDDIVESIVRLLDKPAAADPKWSSERPDPATSSAPFRVFNIGNHQPVELMAYIEAIEKITGKMAKKKFLPIQPGDIPETCADVEDLAALTGFRPNTPVVKGVEKFIGWYRDYYRV